MKVLTSILAGLLLYTGLSAQCSEVQILNAGQQSQLGLLYNQLQTALYSENLNAIDSLSDQALIVLGSEAGQPEAPDNYYTLSTSTTWLSQTSALNLSRLLVAQDSMVYVDIWKVCKGMLPPAYQPHSVPLRAGAEICSGLIRMAHAETDLNRRNLYLQWAMRGLDSLLTMQLPNGAFPFPDLRPYGDPVFSPIINNYMQSLGADSVNVLLNGWIIDDSGTGEFKFDAGVIGGAFVEAFLFTGDTNYRNAAIRTAGYLDTLRMNTNYNYNTFQLYGLSLGYALQPSSTEWIAHADTLIRYSVYPGQMTNGRWMDGHNARSSYHSIIIHNCALYLQYAPPTHQWRDTAVIMMNRALRNFIDYYYACGSSVGYDGLLRAWRLDSTIVPVSLHDSLTDIIGMYINTSNINGRYLDIYTMGLYLDALQNLSDVNTQDVPFGLIWTLYPNPSSGNTSLRFETRESKVITIELLDIRGRKIRDIANGNFLPGIHEVSIEEEGLNDGMYLIRLTDGKQQRTLKWLKQ